MIAQQSLNNPNSWRVTDNDGNSIRGYVDLEFGQYQTYGAKLHHGKGGKRKNLGRFQSLDNAVRAIESDHTQRLTCFSCDDGSTPLYCLNCARKGWIQVSAQIEAWEEISNHPDARHEIIQIAHREINLLKEWKDLND